MSRWTYAEVRLAAGGEGGLELVVALADPGDQLDPFPSDDEGASEDEAKTWPRSPVTIVKPIDILQTCTYKIVHKPAEKGSDSDIPKAPDGRSVSERHPETQIAAAPSPAPVGTTAPLPGRMPAAQTPPARPFTLDGISPVRYSRLGPPRASLPLLPSKAPEPEPREGAPDPTPAPRSGIRPRRGSAIGPLLSRLRRDGAEDRSESGE
ncbi:hypothetical protein H632_c758p0 [Helicosporidium sp. ATCC 50920]|nr:hypothetical protein H632_c758p0 [Helicosporidium sp. ATCC 50920]|eukprot:KDD75298.1 hypothetical protein H632_c758p0 [Helicosporidium sp. ATCC 50920]